jgi:NADH-quinone oxidoreductase subunit J
MELTSIIFYFFAVVTLVSAAIVVFSRNIVHSAFSLLFSFFGVAGLYVLLTADFLAITQLLVYVGGILVLLIFGVMLTNRVISVDIKTGTVQTLPAVLLVAALAGTLVGTFWSTDWKLLDMPHEAVPTAPVFGEKFLTSYLLPFEIASVVLLVALIGAAMIARREKTHVNP